jgi:hypothetical protein
VQRGRPLAEPRRDRLQPARDIADLLAGLRGHVAEDDVAELGDRLPRVFGVLGQEQPGVGVVAESGPAGQVDTRQRRRLDPLRRVRPGRGAVERSLMTVSRCL